MTEDQPLVQQVRGGELNATLASAVAELQQSIWPNDHCSIQTRAAAMIEKFSGYSGPVAQAPSVHWVMDNHHAVAVATATSRTIMTQVGPMTVLALAGVCSAPSFRKKGFGRAVVAQALSRVDDGDFSFGLWQTHRHNVMFYQHFGAKIVDNRFIDSTADQPQANPWWEPVVMRLPNNDDWPQGVIDLQGPGY